MTASSAQLYPYHTTEDTLHILKNCRTCKLLKPSIDFSKNKNTKDGLNDVCRSCRSISRKATYVKKEAIVTVTEKICADCKTLKSASDFYKHPSGKDGLHVRCKSCQHLVIKSRAGTKPVASTIRCPECGYVKHPSAFFIDKSTASGLSGLCKECRAAKKRELRAENNQKEHVYDISSYKTCTKCESSKNISSFYKDKGEHDGLKAICKDCSEHHSKKWRTENPEKVKEIRNNWEGKNKDAVRVYARKSYHKHRDKRLAEYHERVQADPESAKKMSRSKALKRMGANQEWYDAKLAEQNGCCEICGSITSKGHGEVFAIDHNHACCPPGRACDKCRRGLLCRPCNIWLSTLENDEWMRSAITYMNKYNRDWGTKIISLIMAKETQPHQR